MVCLGGSRIIVGFGTNNRIFYWIGMGNQIIYGELYLATGPRTSIIFGPSSQMPKNLLRNILLFYATITLIYQIIFGQIIYGHPSLYRILFAFPLWESFSAVVPIWEDGRSLCIIVYPNIRVNGSSSSFSHPGTRFQNMEDVLFLDSGPIPPHTPTADLSMVNNIDLYNAKDRTTWTS